MAFKAKKVNTKKISKNNNLFQIEEKYNEKASDNEDNSNSDTEKNHNPSKISLTSMNQDDDIIRLVIKKEIDYLIERYKKDKQIQDDQIIKAVISKEILFLFSKYQSLKKKGIKPIQSIPLSLEIDDNQNSPIIDIPLDDEEVDFDDAMSEHVLDNGNDTDNFITCKHDNEKQKKYEEDLNDPESYLCGTYHSQTNKSNHISITDENTEMCYTEENAKVTKQILEPPKVFKNQRHIPVIYSTNHTNDCQLCCNII